MDLRRYKPIVFSAILIASLLGAVDLLARAILGDKPAILFHGEKPLLWDAYQRVGSRTAGLERISQRQPNLQLGVVLGQSSSFRDIDPDLLDQSNDASTRWVVLNGFGGGFSRLNSYSRPLLRSRLHPKVIVLAIHPGMLVTSWTSLTPTALEDGNKLQWSWLMHHRDRVHQQLREHLGQLHMRWLDEFDQSAVARFRAAADPWRGHAYRVLPHRQNDQIQQKQLAAWRAFGWFDSAAYDINDPQADVFRQLVAACSDQTDRLVVLLMPESAALRKLEPSTMMTVMNQLVDEERIKHKIEVINAREAMSEDDFSDYIHLNPQGREKFSLWLAQQLKLNQRDIFGN